jgi:hypothetical protein
MAFVQIGKLGLPTPTPETYLGTRLSHGDMMSIRGRVPGFVWPVSSVPTCKSRKFLKR